MPSVSSVLLVVLFLILRKVAGTPERSGEFNRRAGAVLQDDVLKLVLTQFCISLCIIFTLGYWGILLIS